MCGLAKSARKQRPRDHTPIIAHATYTARKTWKRGYMGVLLETGYSDLLHLLFSTDRKVRKYAHVHSRCDDGMKRHASGKDQDLPWMKAMPHTMTMSNICVMTPASLNLSSM